MTSGKRVLIGSGAGTELASLIEEAASETGKEIVFETKIVGNGLEVIREVHHRSYDLVVVDFILPEMDGLTVSRVIKSVAEWSRIPVFLVSDILDEDIRTACSKLGVEGCFMKPIEKTPFFEAIGKLWFGTGSGSSADKSAESRVKEIVDLVNRVGDLLERPIHLKDFTRIEDSSESVRWDKTYWVRSDDCEVGVGLPDAIGSVGKGIVEILKEEGHSLSFSQDCQVRFEENELLPGYDPGFESYRLEFETGGHCFDLVLRYPEPVPVAGLST